MPPKRQHPRKSKTASAVILVACLLLLTAFSAQAQVTALLVGGVVDPSQGSITRNQVILVSDGKIVDIGPNLAIPARARVIDLSQAYVLPGLMDAHTHISWDSSWGDSGTYGRLMRQSTALRALMAIKVGREVLEAGFTTIRDAGGIEGEYAMTDVREALALGWFVGPTILSCGKIIGPYGGQYHDIAPDYGRSWERDFIDADSPDEVRAAVRRNIFYGANCIKLVADNSPYYYSQEEIKAAVTEAHNAGLGVAVHVLGGTAARNAILAGADSIEHGNDLDNDLLQLMQERGTFLAGTEFPAAHLIAMQRLPAHAETQDRKLVDRLRRAYQLGTKLVFSTDTVVDLRGKTRGQMMLDYLDQWIRAAIPPSDILRAMITNNAELFRLADERGRIATGFGADVIATPRNPLEDIRTLKEVFFVMKDGHIVKHVKATKP